MGSKELIKHVRSVTGKRTDTTFMVWAPRTVQSPTPERDPTAWWGLSREVQSPSGRMGLGKVSQCKPASQTGARGKAREEDV